MTGRNLVAIVDESGGNRPLDARESAFSVGVALFAEGEVERVRIAANRIRSIVGKGDFKYRDVQRSTDARKAFLELMGRAGPSVRAYAFDSNGRAVARGMERDATAERRYAAEWAADGDRPEPAGRPTTLDLLTEFIDKMAPQLARWAWANDSHVQVYWDDRADMDAVHSIWDRSLSTTRFHDAPLASSHVQFGGRTPTHQSAATRVAGVIAGDVRQFFRIHGPSIYSHLDPLGLLQSHDPIVEGLANPHGVMRRAARLRHDLGCPSPSEGSDHTCMLQGWYRSLLHYDETGERLMTFASPDGIYGILRICHRQDWSIYQLPD